MKIFVKFLLVSIIGAFTFACAETAATGIPATFKSTGRVVLEIDDLSYDSLGSPNGRTLFFRLYENDVFEYEEISADKLKSLGFQAFSSEVSTERQGRLTGEEHTEILNLISKADFQKIAFNHKNAKGFCTCGASRLEIRHTKGKGEIKNIIIDGSGCADLTDPSPEVFPKFPKQLSKLLKQVQDVRARYAT